MIQLKKNRGGTFFKGLFICNLVICCYIIADCCYGACSNTVFKRSGVLPPYGVV